MDAMQAYYAQRAPEYDAVYHKPERQAELRELEAWLPAQFERRNVLEVAAGTGYWSQFIEPRAASLTLTDASLETLEIARNRIFGRAVFVQADAYALHADLGSFNAAFAGFWLSHVPIHRRREFLAGLHRLLMPESVVVLIDNRFVEGSSTPLSERDAEGNTWQIRELADGSHHRVLKNFPGEAELQAMIEGLGEDAVYCQTPHFWTFRYLTPGY
jgi:ubiquinone/menaquinone biosynthesis C-methylase UbiE